MQIAEMIVCILAVLGIYMLLCRVLAFFCRRENLSIAVHIDKDEKITETAGDRIRDAILVTESEDGRLMPPVILLEKEPSGEELCILRGYGYPIYYRDRQENQEDV